MKNILFILLIFLANSCKKDPPTTTIEGMVINTGSKEPIKDVKVILTDGIGVSDNFFGSSASTGTGKQVEKTTGADGKFNITIEGEDPHLYLIKEGYRFVFFTYGTSDNFKVFRSGKKYTNEVLDLWADAYFNPVLKGTTSLLSDSVLFDIVYQKTKVGFNRLYFGNGSNKYYEDSKGYKTIGDSYTCFWLKYQTHGVWHEKIDSVFIKSFTTYTDTIFY